MSECVSTKLRVTEEHVCFFMCSFYFMKEYIFAFPNTLTRDKPSATRSATNAQTLKRVAGGVKSVNMDAKRTPNPNILVPPIFIAI